MQSQCSTALVSIQMMKGRDKLAHDDWGVYDPEDRWVVIPADEFARYWAAASPYCHFVYTPLNRPILPMSVCDMDHLRWNRQVIPDRPMPELS